VFRAANIQGESATFLSRSDTSNEAHSEPQPKALHCGTHTHRPRPAATDVVESLGDLVAWRWRSGVHSLAPRFAIYAASSWLVRLPISATPKSTGHSAGPGA